jgi:predicted phosphodiesterase
MRLHILSDLHVEFGPVALPRVEADVTVVAGDVHQGRRGVEWLRQQFPNRPVVYVAGNHEFYHEALPGLLDDLRAACAGTNVHLLENDRIEIGGVTFLGCSLWTDFALFGNQVEAWSQAAAFVTDYRMIRFTDAHRLLRPADTLRRHVESRHWLAEALARADRARTVIVTHHAPSAGSIRPEHRRDLVSAAFASNLDEVVADSGAPLWIHGHTHWCVDYRLGNTQVVSNQRGYPGEDVGGFQPGLVIAV